MKSLIVIVNVLEFIWESITAYAETPTGAAKLAGIEADLSNINVTPSATVLDETEGGTTSVPTKTAGLRIG